MPNSKEKPSRLENRSQPLKKPTVGLLKTDRFRSRFLFPAGLNTTYIVFYMVIAITTNFTTLDKLFHMIQSRFKHPPPPISFRPPSYSVYPLRYMGGMIFVFLLPSSLLDSWPTKRRLAKIVIKA
jgi:hypothetical protein